MHFRHIVLEPSNKEFDEGVCESDGISDHIMVHKPDHARNTRSGNLITCTLGNTDRFHQHETIICGMQGRKQQ